MVSSADMTFLESTYMASMYFWNVRIPTLFHNQDPFFFKGMRLGIKHQKVYSPIFRKR